MTNKQPCELVEITPLPRGHPANDMTIVDFITPLRVPMGRMDR